MSLIIELNASANIFYLLNHLLLLNIVIFKLKCNNLIFNENMILNASYVCLLHSGFIENYPIWILKDGPLISKVVLSHASTPCQWHGPTLGRMGLRIKSGPTLFKDFLHFPIFLFSNRNSRNSFKMK
jgi:hypothetical protein